MAHLVHDCGNHFQPHWRALGHFVAHVDRAGLILDTGAHPDSDERRARGTTTFGGDAAAQSASVKIWGFRGPLGAFIATWGCIAIVPTESSVLLFGDRTPVPYLQTEVVEQGSRFSPDGKWIVYASDESGKNEVYVRPFRGSGGKLLVSASGGSIPVWRHDGKGIFYLGANRELMATRVKQNGSALGIDVIRSLFQTNADTLHNYDVSADGRRVLIVTSTPQKLPSPITVVVNWDAGLRKQ
jgi:hypothetical protein